MATQSATTEKPKAQAPVFEDGFWHFGLLPADGMVDWPVPVKNPTFRDAEFRLEKFKPWDLWNNAGGMEKGLSIFVAKARQFLGLNVRGFHFPSVNYAVEDNGVDISKTAYAGGVARLEGWRVKQVVESCYRHLVRFPQGVERFSDFAHHGVACLDMAHGEKPAGWTDQEWAAYKRQYVIESPATFNPRTDKYVADFVYLYRLNVNDADVDPKDYRANANKVHVGMIGQISRKFFDAPPKSVAEMYPQEKA